MKSHELERKHGEAAVPNTTTAPGPAYQSSIPFQDGQSRLSLQRVLSAIPENQPQAAQRKPNKTGLPDSLKTGLETLSGVDMSSTRVHKNSPKPQAVGAHAYTQGSNIYMAPGQDKHLAHEAWHVVQQAQGRVKPTGSVNGLPLNDSKSLESEADRMGAKAASLG